ncbi:hypothetical protein DFJ77DRAFT_132907 [Powellomyces hirtus]|nr:hypothetical protein DFJ77DRAFT_132907 [Powellomyces hirtus]
MEKKEGLAKEERTNENERDNAKKRISADSLPVISFFFFPPLRRTFKLISVIVMEQNNNSQSSGFRPPPAWHRGGGGGGGRGGRGRGSGNWRPHRGGGGRGGSYRQEPYPTNHDSNASSTSYASYGNVDHRQQFQQPQPFAQPYQYQQYPQQQQQTPESQQQVSAFNQYYPQQSLDPTTSMNPQQHQQYLLQQQQQILLQQQQRNLALLPAAVMAMAGHFGLLAQHQQQEPQQPQTAQFTNTYPQNPTHEQYPPPTTAPTPAIGQYQCIECDKSFHQKSQYVTHCATHIKCEHCDFMASKRVVKIHEEDEHAALIEGLKPAFVSTDSPEEIAKWIADRKKRYPTDANIEAKAKEEQARIDRGELPRGTKRLRGSKRPAPPQRTPREVPIKAEPNTMDVDPAPPLKQVDTGLGLLSGYASDISSSSSSSSASSGANLSATDSETLSSDDDTDSETVAEPTLQAPSVGQQPLNGRKPRICRFFLQKRCLKGDNCAFRHEAPPPRQSQQKGPQQQHNKNQREPQHNRRPLLKSLLESDIRKEKSIVLQCIRHIVQNNFFQPPP